MHLLVSPLFNNNNTKTDNSSIFLSTHFNVKNAQNISSHSIIKTVACIYVVGSKQIQNKGKP